MADIFLSYARADQPRIAKLAAALEAEGHSVWWDRHIDGGAEFSADIERELEAARAVIVAWSKDSTNSRWVRDEAGIALEDNKLIAISIDSTPPPIGFKQIHAIDMKRPDGLDDLMRSLANKLGGGTSPASPPTTPSAKRSSKAALFAIPLVAAVGGLGYWVWEGGLSGESETSEQANAELSVAILPFAVSGEGLEDTGTGMARSLSTGLGALNGLQLISPTSARALAGENLTLREIGERLGASHLVEGEISGTGDQLRLAVRLVEAQTGRQLWQREYRESRDNFANLQNLAGRDLAIAMQVRLGVGGGNYTAQADVPSEAYQAYLRGLEDISARNVDADRREAINQLRLATTIAPDFADAHAALAYILSLTDGPEIGMTLEDLRALEARSLERALELDPDHPLARITSIAIDLREAKELEQSLAKAKVVLEDAPNLAPAHFLVADILAQMRRNAEALAPFERAIALDPYNDIVRVQRARTYLALDDVEGVRQEIARCRVGCERQLRIFYFALLKSGDNAIVDRYWDDFVRELGRVVGSTANAPRLKATLDALLAQPAATAMAPAFGLPDLGSIFTEENNEDYASAAIQARTGNLDAAFAQLREGLNGWPVDINEILNDTHLSFTPEQRADPRYRAIFEHEALQRLVAYRESKGLYGGHPLEPSEVKAEKARLAALER